MRRAALWVALVLVATLACSSEDPIVGSWGGRSVLGEPLVLTFSKNGRIRVEYTRHGTVNSGSFWLDRSTDPIGFDYQLDGRGRIKTIIEFPGADTLAFEEVGSSSEPRPVAFGRHRLVFTRR
jgi:hypothetical protein